VQSSGDPGLTDRGLLLESEGDRDFPEIVARQSGQLGIGQMDLTKCSGYDCFSDVFASLVSLLTQPIVSIPFTGNFAIRSKELLFEGLTAPIPASSKRALKGLILGVGNSGLFML
jgi:hypothetical protein